jgi:glycosyltransferase involved in cell wall biosynthesis
VKTIKITHVNTHDSGGGAARAAYRLHRGLVASGIDSRMRVRYGDTEDDLVITGASLSARALQALHCKFSSFAHRHWRTANPVYHSFGQHGAGLVEELNASDADLLNLHWVAEMLSVKDIGKLKKPIVWTLHDMWAFCGGEHLSPDDEKTRFRLGYRTDNRPSGEAGPDLNQRTWQAKRRKWARQRFTIVTPSQWLARCARESVLFSQSPVQVIPNCLDTANTWRPIPRDAACVVLGLPSDKKIIMFGAYGGLAEHIKGGDLLRETIFQLVENSKNIYELLIFGEEKPNDADGWPCQVHWLGAVRDDRILAQAYSAADVMVVPSRQDNLPNTAIEAQACGTPVAAFNVGGLPDIVTHRETGWLSMPFDTADLAAGLAWLLEDSERLAIISAAARNHAVSQFSESVVSAKYLELYHQILGRH